MRTRKEIEENMFQHDLDYAEAETLRLLLDIRDLLVKIESAEFDDVTQDRIQ